MPKRIPGAVLWGAFAVSFVYGWARLRSGLREAEFHRTLHQGGRSITATLAQAEYDKVFAGQKRKAVKLEEDIMVRLHFLK